MERAVRWTRGGSDGALDWSGCRARREVSERLQTLLVSPRDDGALRDARLHGRLSQAHPDIEALRFSPLLVGPLARPSQ
jgi:hypothetical protein